MMNGIKRMTLLSMCVVAGMLMAAAKARAEDFVRDQASLFSAQAVSAANAKIGEIRSYGSVGQKSGKSLVIETMGALPGGASIDDEAHRRFQSERINGVLVLICANPHKIAVRVGRKTAEVFGKDQQDELRKNLLDHFKNKDFDGGLTAAVEYADGVFSGAMSATRQAERAPRHRGHAPYGRGEPYSRPSPGMGIWGILVLVLIAFFVISMLRGIFGAFSGGGAGIGGATPVGSGGIGGSGWGGGFLSGLLGGAIGSVIGNSLYGMFSGPREGYNRDEPTAYADDAGQSEGSIGQASEWTQDDSSAGGGDVGDSSDWGGGDVGDSGSSDSGGGDW